MGRVLPRPIRNKVGYEFLKKTLNGFRSDPGFIKKIRDLTRNLVIYNFIITKISSYIYIYIYKGGRDTTLEAEAQLYSDNIT